MLLLKSIFSDFWQRYPAFFYGLFLSLIALVAFGYYDALFVLAFLFLFVTKRQKITICLLFAIGFPCINYSYHFPSSSEVVGTGNFTIKEVKKARRGWIYKGKLHSFIPQNSPHSIAKNVPCTLYSSSYLPSDQDYSVNGLLKEIYGKHYTIKTKEQWDTLKPHRSLASWRYQAKQDLSVHLKKAIPYQKAASFLAGLATGQLSDLVLLKEFEKKGLSHLLAISGFHFAVLALSCHVLLRLLFKPKMISVLLILILTAYFLFIGNAASVQRAYVIALLFLLSQLFERDTSGLNSLGIALLLAFCLDPLTISNAGFQLSYMATFAILLLLKPIQNAISTLFPSNLLPLRWTKEAFALCFAIYSGIGPLLLIHFHKFPLHGFFYNLFFPFLVTISFILLIVSSSIYILVPFLGLKLHALNGWYTECILDLLSIPFIPHKTLYVEKLPPLTVAIYWLILFGGSIFIQYRRKKQEEKMRDEFRFF